MSVSMQALHYQKMDSTVTGSAASHSMQSKNKLESSTASDNTKFYTAPKNSKEASNKRELTHKEQVEDSV